MAQACSSMSNFNTSDQVDSEGEQPASTVSLVISNTLEGNSLFANLPIVCLLSLLDRSKNLGGPLPDDSPPVWPHFPVMLTTIVRSPSKCLVRRSAQRKVHEFTTFFDPHHPPVRGNTLESLAEERGSGGGMLPRRFSREF